MAVDLGIEGEALEQGAFHGRRALLVIAHPGHELRVHHWLETTRPEVLVLTDGAGRSDRSRLPATAALLAAAGARAGAIFGRLSDREMYAAILERRTRYFVRLAEELAGCLHDVDYVVGDAAEGYNPAHDLCRSVIDAAVGRARSVSGRPIANFSFSLVGPPGRSAGAPPGTLELRLGEEAFARKLAAARAYEALDGEVKAALLASGPEPFRVEALEPVIAGPPSPDEQPEYERHGERRVASGLYPTVLRRREHMLPIAEALRAMEER